MVYLVGILFLLGACIGRVVADICYAAYTYSYYTYYCEFDCCGYYYYSSCCSGISSASIAGAVIGSTFGIVILVVIVIIIIKRCTRNRTRVIVGDTKQPRSNVLTEHRTLQTTPDQSSTNQQLPNGPYLLPLKQIYQPIPRTAAASEPANGENPPSVWT